MTVAKFLPEVNAPVRSPRPPRDAAGADATFILTDDAESGRGGAVKPRGRDDDGGRRRKVREKDEEGLGVGRVTHSLSHSCFERICGMPSHCERGSRARARRMRVFHASLIGRRGLARARGCGRGRRLLCGARTPSSCSLREGANHG